MWQCSVLLTSVLFLSKQITPQGKIVHKLFSRKLIIFKGRTDVFNLMRVYCVPYLYFVIVQLSRYVTRGHNRKNNYLKNHLPVAGNCYNSISNTLKLPSHSIWYGYFGSEITNQRNTIWDLISKQWWLVGIQDGRLHHCVFL